MGNLDTSLYHLQQISLLSSDELMQGRCKTLQGHIYIQQNKPIAALELLQSVGNLEQIEVKIPFCAFLTAVAYENLGIVRKQAEVLDLLSQYLLAEPNLQPRLSTPLIRAEQLFLFSVHNQSETKIEEVLESCAKAYLASKKPRKASEKLMQLLNLTSLHMNDFESNKSMWKLSELLHDAAASFLEADCKSDAQHVCEAAIKFHIDSRLTLDLSNNLSDLKEDVIALLLLAHAIDPEKPSQAQEILNRCGKLLQDHLNDISKLSEGQEHCIMLCKALLARTYLHKALLNCKRKFLDDAVACFQRALHWREDDSEVILQFTSFLLNNGQIEESLALWSMYDETKNLSSEVISCLALKFLLGERMDPDEKEEVMCRIHSLTST